MKEDVGRCKVFPSRMMWIRDAGDVRSVEENLGRGRDRLCELAAGKDNRECTRREARAGGEEGQRGQKGKQG